MILTDTQKLNYERDGFLIYGSMLSEKELEDLSQRIDALASGEHCNAEKAGMRLEGAAIAGELQDVPRRDKVWQLGNPAGAWRSWRGTHMTTAGEKPTSRFSKGIGSM